MALGSTQPLTEMSTRCISWGKGGRCVRLTTLPQSCAVVMKSGNLKFLEPSGPLQACNGTVLPLHFTLQILTFQGVTFEHIIFTNWPHIIFHTFEQTVINVRCSSRMKENISINLGGY